VYRTTGNFYYIRGILEIGMLLLADVFEVLEEMHISMGAPSWAHGGK
jgi:hypothetical protein